MTDVILLSGLGQCLVIAGFLHSKSKQYPLFSLLMIIHLVFGSDLLLLLAQHEQWISHRINACFGAMYAILFFIFIRSCLGIPPSKKQLCLFLGSWFGLNALIFDFLLEPSNVDFNLRHVLASYFLIVIYLFFTMWGCLTVYKYHKKQKDYLANLSKENLWVLWGICACLLFAILTIPLKVMLQTSLPLPQLLMCIMMFVISYALLINPHLLTFEKFKKEYQDTIQTENEFDAVLADQILYLLDKDEIYKDPDLSLQSLSNKLSMKPYLVSQVINHYMGVSFYEMINHRRINYTCELMELYPYKPVLDIALQAGFNSKSTFNSAFKKYKGVTPTQFKSSKIGID